MSTRVTLVNGTGAELGTAVDPLNVEGTLTTTISTIDTVTNLVQQGGVAISLNTGVRDTGTQRVTIATNDSVPVTFTGSTDVATQTTLASALTSLQTLDNAISGAGFNITQIGGAVAPIGAGLEATAVRVTLPTDGTGVVKLGAGTAEIGKLAAGLANIGDVDVATIATGDNNIGNVDIVSGTITTVSTVTNLSQLGGAAVPIGAGLEVTAVRVTLPTDGTGVVKLGAGTAEIGKLAAGLANIGDVDVATIAAGDNNIGNVDIASGTLTTVSTVTNLSQLGGANVPIGAGLEVTAVRVTLPTDGTGVVKLGAGTAGIGKLTTNSGVDIGDVDVLSIAAGDNNIGNVDVASIAAGDNNIGNVDIVSGTITTVSTVTSVTAIANALPAGTNAIGKLAANSGVDIGDVDVTSISAGTNLIGDIDVQPRTTGGWSVGNFTSGDTYTALTATAQVLKASAGKFGGYYIYNPNSAATYVLVYNIAAASVTVGTSTALLVFCIPATSGANLEILAGIPFGTAMSIAAATTGGGNTAPTTALEAMIWYK